MYGNTPLLNAHKTLVATSTDIRRGSLQDSPYTAQSTWHDHETPYFFTKLTTFHAFQKYSELQYLQKQWCHIFMKENT